MCGWKRFTSLLKQWLQIGDLTTELSPPSLLHLQRKEEKKAGWGVGEAPQLRAIEPLIPGPGLVVLVRT